MADFFIGEIKMFGFGFTPKYWAQCNGQLLPIQQNAALFSLLGTTYGGNGTQNFALPDFRSRVPVHVGNGFTQGQRAGTESHTLNIGEMPAHTHTHSVSGVAGAAVIPVNNAFGNSAVNLYATQNNQAQMTLGNAGGNQSHPNIQPYLTLNFCIALQGIYPSRN